MPDALQVAIATPPVFVALMFWFALCGHLFEDQPVREVMAWTMPLWVFGALILLI